MGCGDPYYLTAYLLSDLLILTANIVYTSDFRMDPNNNQQNGPDGSKVPYAAGTNHSYQCQPFVFGTQGQAYLSPYQGQPIMYATQGPSSGGLNMPMMQPSVNVPQAPQPAYNVELVDDEVHFEVLTTPPVLASAGKGSHCRSSNFSNAEDLYLVKSWLEISTDATVGTGKKRDRLWQRIFER